MTSNPYDSPDFARSYTLAQADIARNRYEWLVTSPGVQQFLGEDVDSVLDYGCGSGVFTAAMAHSNPNAQFVGTDSSNVMLHYAQAVGRTISNASFEHWNAMTADLLSHGDGVDRVIAKLVLNYIDKDELAEHVFPRLRDCLNESGLLIAVLPNPLREVKYNIQQYQSTEELTAEIGNFDDLESTNIYLHTMEDMFDVAHAAGFACGNVFGLPAVRFEPYRQLPFGKQQLMRIADPFPLDPYVNAAKRWLYVFGTTADAFPTFDQTTNRFEAWRKYYYPEIADVAFCISPDNEKNKDLVIPSPENRTMHYGYGLDTNPTRDALTIVGGKTIENATPRMKIALGRRLAKLGIREPFCTQDHLVPAIRF